MNNKNTIKITVLLFSFFLLFSAVQIPVHAINLNENRKLNENHPPGPEPFKAYGEFIYNVTDAEWQDQVDELNVSTYDEMDMQDRDVGQFIVGENFIFRLGSAIMNDTEDPPRVAGFEGEINGKTFWEPLRFKTEYHQINEIINQSYDGPAMVYFVIPGDVNFTEAETDFSDAGFSVSNDVDYFSVNYENSTYKLYAQWNKSTNSLNKYFFHTGNAANVLQNITLGFELVLFFDPGKHNPVLTMQDPLLFYSFDEVNVGGNNTIELGDNKDQESHDNGYFEEGQVVQVRLHTWPGGPEMGGPGYEGEIESRTGHSHYNSPFSGPNDHPECPPEDTECMPPLIFKAGENHEPQGNKGPDGPPFLAFLLPVSTDAWLDDFEIFIESEQDADFDYDSTSIYLYMEHSEDVDQNVTVTWDKNSGLMTDYVMNMMFPDDMGGHHQTNLALSLYSSYDLADLNPSWGVSEGDQFKYSIDSIVGFDEDLDNTTNRIELDEGYMEQGQELHIRFDSFSLENGPHAHGTVQTVTGKAETNMSLGGDDQEDDDGPLFFTPILPLDDDGLFWDILEDQFGAVYEGDIVSTDDIFSIELSDSVEEGVTIEYNVYAEWDKATGLLQEYNYTVWSSGDGTVYASIVVTFIGESSGDVYIPPTSEADNSTDSSSTGGAIGNTPGFEIIPLLAGMGIVAIVIRNRKE